MIISKQLLALVPALLLTSSAVFAGYDGAVAKSDVETLFSGNTLQGKHSVKGFEVELFVNSDGTAIEKRGKNTYPGKWHMDDEGRFCWALDAQGQKWSGQLWCRWVVKTGENEYIKVKDDGKEVRRFTVLEGRAF